MRSVQTIVVAYAAAMLLGSTVDAQLTGAQKQQALDEHNLWRCSVSPAAAAMPPLVWDSRLAQVAQNWANQCTDSGIGLLAHNANRSTDYASLGGSGYVGENIYGTTGAMNPVDGVDLWDGEKVNYTLATNACASGQVCGHYTQLVWAGTTLVGCAAVSCGNLTYPNDLVCDYAPGGNIGGQFPYTAGSGANYSCAAHRSDFNADKSSDIVLRNYSTGQNAIWLMNGTTLLSIHDLPALPDPNWHIEGTADFNGDGQSDILLRNYATGQDALWLMNGTTLSSIVDLPALTNTAYHFEGVGDFNGDGKPDIILRNYTTGQDALWLMNGTALQSIVDLPALPNTAFKIESAGDFNGDGQTDIVLRNYTTGQDALWLLNGTTLLSIVDLPALPNTAYRFDGVADMNSDLKPDILLRNYTTGQNAVWLMNGTSLSSIVDLPALPNTAYEINGPR